MIKKIFPLLAVIVAFAMTSCLGNKDEEQKQSITVKCYNKINGDDGATVSAANYIYDFDFLNGTVDVTTFDTKICATSFKICGLKLEISADKGYTFSATAPKVTDLQGNALNTIMISNFYGQYGGPTLKVRYDVNGETEVFASPIEDLYQFSTTTTQNGSELFTWDDATYDILYNFTDNTAKLTIKNIKFAEKMPLTLTEMVVEGLTVTPTTDGLKVSVKEATPKIGDKPYPNYVITDLEGFVTPNFSVAKYFLTDQLNMKFKCMGYDVNVNAFTFEQAK